jgi:Kef-type K+ transport system membrane component KefB/mannitol/fructose-specific phosphotransferase system IIA component
MHYLDETYIKHFLVQLFLILLLARGFGELLRRWKQPTLTAELLVGILLGPTILGRFFPDLHAFIFPMDVIQQNMLETVAWVGLLGLLLQTGLEIDFSIAWRQRGNALTIALLDVIIPMIIAFIPCLFLPADYLVDGSNRIVFALFMATVMTISAMPVAARVLQDLQLLKTDLGFLVMSALAVNDIIGWVLFTIVLGLFSQGTFEGGPVVIVLVATIGFAVLAIVAGRPLSTRAVTLLHRLRVPEPGGSLTFIVLLGVLFGAITEVIGIHALFGFFIAGVVMGEAKSLSEETRSSITHTLDALFVPVFFVNIGLKLDFVGNFDLFLVTFVTLIGIAGRFLGAWIGVRWTGFSRQNRYAMAVAHTPGGMMEIVVALLALQTGLITQPVFLAIVFSAVFSSIIVGPWLARVMRPKKAIDYGKLVSRELVVADLDAATPLEAIGALAERAAGTVKGLDAELLRRKVMEREELFGTALEHGVAIPHARMTGLKAPLIAFARSHDGIDWNAPDGDATHLIFLTVMPQEMDSLANETLAAIARAMHEPANREALATAENVDELWQRLREALSAGSVPRPSRP